MIEKRNFKIAYKLFFSLLGFAAIVTEIAVISERGVFNPVNFFSFFTIQTNILAFVILILGAIAVASKTSKRWLDILRSSVTVYILVVGIGFAVLLSGIDGVVLTAVPWDNIVLHYIIPIAVLIDLLIDRPKRKISFKLGLIWITYPILYVAYSLIRGSITGWYPYPFLNPGNEGMNAVMITVLGLVILGVLLVWAVTRIAKQNSNIAKLKSKS